MNEISKDIGPFNNSASKPILFDLVLKFKLQYSKALNKRLQKKATDLHKTISLLDEDLFNEGHFFRVSFKQRKLTENHYYSILAYIQCLQANFQQYSDPNLILIEHDTDILIGILQRSYQQFIISNFLIRRQNRLSNLKLKDINITLQTVDRILSNEILCLKEFLGHDTNQYKLDFNTLKMSGNISQTLQELTTQSYGYSKLTFKMKEKELSTQLLYNIIYNVFNNDDVYKENECIVIAEFIQAEKKPFIVIENTLIIYIVSKRVQEVFVKNVNSLQDQMKMLQDFSEFEKILRSKYDFKLKEKPLTFDDNIDKDYYSESAKILQNMKYKQAEKEVQQELNQLEKGIQQQIEKQSIQIQNCLKPYEIYLSVVKNEKNLRLLMKSVREANQVMFYKHGQISVFSKIIGEIITNLKNFDKINLIQDIYVTLNSELQMIFIKLLSDVVFNTLSLGDYKLADIIKRLYEDQQEEWQKCLIIQILQECLTQESQCITIASNLIQDKLFLNIIKKLMRQMKIKIQQPKELFKYPNELTQNLFIISKDHLILLDVIIQQYYANTQKEIYCQAILEYLRSDEIRSYILNKELKYSIIVDIDPNLKIRKIEKLLKVDSCLTQIISFQTKVPKILMDQEMTEVLKYLESDEVINYCKKIKDDQQKRSQHFAQDQVAIDFQTHDISWSTINGSSDKMRFHQIYKYNSNDELQLKKCVKQIHKQIILPKIIQNPQITFIQPLYDLKGDGGIEYSEMKTSVVYYAIKDLMEMYQETSLTSHLDKTPRNQICLEIFDLEQQSQRDGLLAKLDICSPQQALQILVQQLKSRSKQSLKLMLKYKSILANFIFLRKSDSVNDNTLEILKSEILLSQNSFFLFHHNIGSFDIKQDINSFKNLTQTISLMLYKQKEECNRSAHQSSDLIMNLQSQIEELKSQLNSQSSLINKLCSGKQSERNSTQKISKRRRSTTIKSNSKKSKFSKQLQHNHSKNNSNDYDQVIIEDENEQDQSETNNESRFNGELSIVAAAANNQGDNNTDCEASTQVIEDLSMLRKLSLEINRNYEKFAEFRKSLNYLNSNSHNSKGSDSVLRQSASSSNPILSCASENQLLLVAAEVEKQFKNLVEQKLMKSQKEREIIEEALQMKNNNQRPQQQQKLQQDHPPPQNNTRNYSKNTEIERIIQMNMMKSSTNGNISQKYKYENHISEVLESEESFGEFGEESIANEHDLESNKKKAILTMLPSNKEPSKFIDSLNVNQVVKKQAHKSSTKVNKPSLPPMNPTQIVKLYQTDLPISASDTERSNRMPQFIDNNPNINNNRNYVQNYSNRIGQATHQGFYNTQSTVLTQTNVILKNRPKSKNSNSTTSQNITHNVFSLKSGNNHSKNGFKIQNISQQNQSTRVATIDLHKAGVFGKKNNSLSGVQSTSSASSFSYQSIAQTAANALKNLNSKIRNKKKSLPDNPTLTTNIPTSSQKKQVGSKEKTRKTNEQQNEKATYEHQSILEPEKASRSPSIKDERSSLQVGLERPKGFLMNEKNYHQLYFKIQSKEPSRRNSNVTLSPKLELNIISSNETNTIDDKQQNSGSNKGNVPRISLSKKPKLTNGEQIRSLDHSEKAMIAKFYHNQPKSPLKDQNDQNQTNINCMQSSSKRLTDLKEARMKNRSESRKKQNRHYLMSSLSQNQYSSLTRSGIYTQSSNQFVPNNNNTSTLDETIQVVKDMLQIKRNQSHTSMAQIMPSNNLYGPANQSVIGGINASILFDKSHSQLNETMQQQYPSQISGGGIATLKKPPINIPKVNIAAINSGKENLDEFFQLYETFKQQSSAHKQQKDNILSPEESRRQLFYQSNSNQNSRLFLAGTQQQLHNSSHQQLLRLRSTSEYNHIYSMNNSQRQPVHERIMRIQNNQKEL